MSEDTKAKLRRYSAAALALVLSVALGFTAGHFSAPVKTETRIEYRDLTVEDLTKGMTFNRTVTVTRWRNVTTTTTDAGVVTVDKTIEREGGDETAVATETSKSTSDKSGSSYQKVTLRPAWRISTQVGASLKPPALEIAGPLVLGASVETRIAQTPFSVGLWGNTVGAGGVVLSGEF